MRRRRDCRQSNFPALSTFFSHLDGAVRTLGSELDHAEADYLKVVTAIQERIAGVDRSLLELYDVAELYSGQLKNIATVSCADGQLAGRGVVPVAADTALIGLRGEVEIRRKRR
ncbi:hypothetical protein [Amycolatopsis sp. cg13]|uniref:hypothetical protein n=1 Tax=Amycolatopsis sp. cg13 TaxID=3238807 RepID=UPI003526021E